LLCAVSLIAASCADRPPPDDFELEVRHTDPLVTGNDFQCTGTWPSSLTPCHYSWNSQPATHALGDDADLLHVTLLRVPIPIDGGASFVHLDLRYSGGELRSATAHESTSMAGTAREIETSVATAGWIDPSSARVRDARNAARFSLTFTWGSISGTYDVAP
jgi:hypothetical protein